jgi:parallel beta-helix repeat protein
MENSPVFTMKRYLRGLMTLALLTITLLLTTHPARAAAFLVNSTGNSPDGWPGDGRCQSAGGLCTLRAAIQEANARPGEDLIGFGLSGSGTRTITVTSQLPDITDRVSINGGAALDKWNTPAVRVDGNNNPWNGFRFMGAGASGSRLEGLMITRFDSAAIYVDGASTLYISKNFIGTDGKSNQGNKWGVILHTGASGADIADNVISGSTVSGVVLRSGVSTVIVERNLIGLNAQGTAAIPNATGVAVESASNSYIEDNIISGNQVGVQIKGISEVSVYRNRIGSDRSGTLPVLNSQYGVSIEENASVLLGSWDNFTGTASGNLFFQNGVRDVRFTGASSTMDASAYNCFTGSTGIENNSTGSVSMENNWYGAPSGPRVSGPGGGAPLVGTGVTDYDPWLNVPAAPCAARYAVNIDGNLEIDADSNGRPDHWNFNNLTGADGLDCNTWLDGFCPMKLVGTGANKRMNQTTGISGSSGVWVGISLRMMGYDLPNNGTSTATVRLRNSANNIVHEQVVDLPYGDVDYPIAVQTGFRAPVNFASIEIRILYGRNNGTIWFDNIYVMIYPHG